MSHKTEIKTKLTNLQHITNGLDAMGAKDKVAQNGEKFKTAGNWRSNKGEYEEVDILITELNGKSTGDAIGLAKQSDGTYVAMGDFYNLGLESDLRNTLTTEAIKSESNERLSQLGYQMQNDVEVKDGYTVVTYTKY